MAQQTLNQVQEIETAINSSEHIRQEVISVQQQTDTKIADINNITRTVREANMLETLFEWMNVIRKATLLCDDDDGDGHGSEGDNSSFVFRLSIYSFAWEAAGGN